MKRPGNAAAIKFFSPAMRVGTRLSGILSTQRSAIIPPEPIDQALCKSQLPADPLG
jgi:hypothetical protein